MGGAPLRALSAGARTLELGHRPVLMGVVNATPDSFSDRDAPKTVSGRVGLARRLIAGGAEIIDVGGESGTTDRPAVAPREEIDRVVPLIEQVIQLGAMVSVDTYKVEVARAAIAAGASIVNDTSGLRDPELADLCAETGAALVLMHTRAEPKQKLLEPRFDGRVVEDALGFLGQRIELALARGVAFEQLIVDPGPDFGKTPAQTVELVRALGRLHELRRPLLLAVSRKDFIGAITGAGPLQRLAGTLAAVDHGVRAGAHILRVHDVPEVADFLAVQAVLEGDADIGAEVRLADELRWARRTVRGRR